MQRIIRDASSRDRSSRRDPNTFSCAPSPATFHPRLRSNCWSLEASSASKLVLTNFACACITCSWEYTHRHTCARVNTHTHTHTPVCVCVYKHVCRLGEGRGKTPHGARREEGATGRESKQGALNVFSIECVLYSLIEHREGKQGALSRRKPCSRL